VPATVYESLKTVEGLRKAKSAARESEPVSAVSVEVIQQTLVELSRTVGAMAQLQLLTGARPGEICRIRPRNVVIPSNGLWCYVPESHKTEHHGKQRRVYLGPEAQSVLQPFMDRNSTAFCFSPSEAEKERHSRLRRERQTPVQPSQRARRKRRPQRRPGERYTKDSYRWAIRRACERASVPIWTPHQLRHTRATQLRKKFGIEAARVVLGHSDPRVTEIYAERDFKLAEEIMSKTG
jgi:integrase